MSRPNIQRWLELLSRLSLGAQYRLAAPIAALVAYTPNQISRAARANIDLCFGHLEEAEKRRLYRDTIRHTCYAMTELGAVWCWPVDRVLARVRSVDICEEFERSQRPRIILVPHLGSWETIGVWFGRHCEAIMLYRQRRQKYRETDSYIAAARSRSGGTLVPTSKQGLRELLVGLKQGRSILILPDQRPRLGKAYIDSTFFGHDAPTTTLVQNLCSKIECDVFIASALRSTPPGEFDLRISSLEHARLAGDKVASAQYMNNAIEALVRTCPAQYQWGYQRFSKSTYAASAR